MKDWFADPWIRFASEMMDEFMEDGVVEAPLPTKEVWDKVEVLYFCLAFTAWSVERKFRRRTRFGSDRKAEYQAHITAWMKDLSKAGNDPDTGGPSFRTCFEREQEYVSFLSIGSFNIFQVLCGSAFDQACSTFISYACKNQADFQGNHLDTISRWLRRKLTQFKREVSYR
jgi:hypothetical protein